MLELNSLLSKPLKVREIETYPPLLLAPMSGVTNSAFRRLIRRKNPGTVGLVVTEFISIEALTRQVKRSLEMMRFAEEERPIAIQIFGYDINRMCEAAKIAEQAGAEIVDINSGCPAPKVVRKGGGCELMRQPEHIGKILEAVSKSISVPLTLKFRSGWDDKCRNAVEVARIAEACGVQMVTVHGRTRVQLYRGLADYEIVNEVVNAVSIPVVGSGDIVDRASAAVRAKSGIAGLMIGRGALENPWVFNDIVHGEVPRKATEIPDVMIEYMELLQEELPEKAVIGKMKQFASQVTKTIRGSAEVRRELCRCPDTQGQREILALWRKKLEDSDETILPASERAPSTVGIPSPVEESAPL